MIINGNSLDLPLADDSVDAVICDPPYGILFMGRDWDKAVPSVDIWIEVLRVLKPGAFAAILCTPRQDCQAEMIKRLTAAGFDVGFTSIMWTYATGFPKAANLSKLADKRAGAEREIVGKHPAPASNNGRFVGIDGGCGFSGAVNITIPATPEAKALEGAYAGYQPKPAFEPVLVVMKPLAERTYLDQALANGHGCSWLDAGRIPTTTADYAESKAKNPGRSDLVTSGVYGANRPQQRVNTAGRFPANVLCCDDVLNDGETSKSIEGRPMDGKHGNGWRMTLTGAEYSDSGSYSRYFDLDAWWTERIAQLPESVRRVFPWLIVPKPSKREKNAGLDRAPVTVGDGRQKSIDNPFQRGQTERVNSHVSVKPVRLMSYLVTLFSQPGDVVLDPFAGSGSTGVACAIMARYFVGVELDPEYTQIAASRTRYAERHDGATMAFELQPEPTVPEIDPRQTSILDVIGDGS